MVTLAASVTPIKDILISFSKFQSLKYLTILLTLIGTSKLKYLLLDPLPNLDI